MKAKKEHLFLNFLCLMIPTAAAVWLLCTAIFGYAPFL